MLAGLLGTFMISFSGTMNAARAYIVNDIYLKYVNPAASNKSIITMNYPVGIIVVAIGVILGFFAHNVNRCCNGSFWHYMAAMCGFQMCRFQMIAGTGTTIAI